MTAVITLARRMACFAAPGCGTALACRRHMVRRAGMVPVMLAVLMLYPPPASSPRSAQPNPRPAVAAPQSVPPAPSVRVEHELIRLPNPQAPKVSRPRGWRSTRLALSAAEARPPLIVRARRALVGDGRYRPEPFPRLER